MNVGSVYRSSRRPLGWRLVATLLSLALPALAQNDKSAPTESKTTPTEAADYALGRGDV